MQYKKDYFGYVYIWRDRKRNKYCIGSHHGAVDDSYITSSKYMIQAYKRRPEDFKMRVLAYNTTSTDYLETQKLEQLALNLIKDDELSHRYYNLKKSATGGNGMIGARWYYKGAVSRLLFDTDAIPDGFTAGYNPNIKTTNNWVWYHDPKNITNDMLVDPSLTPPVGWVKGRPNIACTGLWFKDPESDMDGRYHDIDDVPYGWIRGRQTKCTEGWRWSHNEQNPEETLYLMADEDLPEGYVYGMTHKGSANSYYNAKTKEERKFLDDETIPAGFVRGGKPRAEKKKEKFGKMTPQEFTKYCTGKTTRAIKMVQTYRDQYTK